MAALGSAVVDYFITSTDNLTMVDDFDVKLVHDVASKYNIAIDCTLPDLKMLFGDDVCVNSVLREPRCRPKMTGNNDLLKCNAYSIEDLCANCESFLC